MPLPRSKLYASIISITSQPEDHILKAMTALCHDDKFREKAYLYLGKLARHAKELEKNNSTTAATGSKKRDLKTMLDVEICIQCEQTFHEDDNDEKSCFYHPYEMEEDQDSDVWAEWDERCHGPIDTETNRKSFPDGFIYNCCGKNGTTKGCTWGEHKTAEDPEDVLDAHVEQMAAAIKAKRAKVIPGGLKYTVTGVGAAQKNRPPAKALYIAPTKVSTCVQCKVVFYEPENSETSCCYHDGETYLDRDAQELSSLKGPDSLGNLEDMDDSLTRAERPKGFKYSCCQQSLEPGQKGCKQGKHRAEESNGADESRKDGKTSKKTDGEDKENQPQEVIEISDDSE